MSSSEVGGAGATGRLPAAYHDPALPSFADFVDRIAPGRLPGGADLHGLTLPPDGLPHGTTIVVLRYADGVVMAGDRRSTMGNVIAARDLDKVFVADDRSLVGIAGTAGIAVELVKLLQVELEHFEKIEGTPLSLEGKANRLASMIRGNLGLALRGLAVVPVFAGVEPAGFSASSDLPPQAGPVHARIFSYDVTGGCYEEQDHHSVGSGSVFARGALKKLWRPGLAEEAAVRVAVEALYDAADDDAATGGPDLGRRIWPTCLVVDAEGARRRPESGLAELVAAIVADRDGNPGGAR